MLCVLCMCAYMYVFACVFVDAAFVCVSGVHMFVFHLKCCMYMHTFVYAVNVSFLWGQYIPSMGVCVSPLWGSECPLYGGLSVPSMGVSVSPLWGSVCPLYGGQCVPLWGSVCTMYKHRCLMHAAPLTTSSRTSPHRKVWGEEIRVILDINGELPSPSVNAPSPSSLH